MRPDSRTAERTKRSSPAIVLRCIRDDQAHHSVEARQPMVPERNGSDVNGPIGDTEYAHVGYCRRTYKAGFWWAFRTARAAAVLLGVSWTVPGLTWDVAGQDAISDNMLGLLGVVALFDGMPASLVAFALAIIARVKQHQRWTLLRSRCCGSRYCSPSWRSPKRPGSNRRLVGLDHRPRTPEPVPPPNRQIHHALVRRGPVSMLLEMVEIRATEC